MTILFQFESMYRRETIGVDNFYHPRRVHGINAIDFAYMLVKSFGRFSVLLIADGHCL